MMGVEKGLQRCSLGLENHGFRSARILAPLSEPRCWKCEGRTCSSEWGRGNFRLLGVSTRVRRGTDWGGKAEDTTLAGLKILTEARVWYGSPSSKSRGWLVRALSGRHRRKHASQAVSTSDGEWQSESPGPTQGR